MNKMDKNEISMLLDVKMDIHDKRNEIRKFKVWTKCQVKIEAVKCVPCFLRLTFEQIIDESNTAIDTDDYLNEEKKKFSVSINVPGVTISLASSRTKQFSYGIFWTHNRRDCFIYFALETETSCKKHMKWVKKSIKNLELFRQVFLEQRRNSRGSAKIILSENPGTDECFTNNQSNLLGPLPQLPDDFFGSPSSRRISKSSVIYEEIAEHSRNSRRVSRSSIASGIYEEMKPFTAETNCNTISEETASLQDQESRPIPPPIPPLPASRKRINTSETDHTNGFLGDIPRSSTNPESEMAKKKKYRFIMESLFGVRSKRSESVSETQACTVEDLIDKKDEFDCGNDIIVAKKRQIHCRKMFELSQSKRNSFSSPDLSKINFLDTFDEEKVVQILQNSFESNEDLELSTQSLDESSIPSVPVVQSATALLAQIKAKSDSIESLNISQQIPTNFNFSACNNSKINLVGANGAVIQSSQKQKILIDDLTGYCVMAPIVKKTSIATNENPLRSTESTSSGYSTGSYTSTCSSSCTNSTEDNLVNMKNKPVTVEVTETKDLPVEESVVYENMCGADGSFGKDPIPLDSGNFTEHLYENLLTIKAAQELEAPNLTNPTMSTSTPTDSPLTCSSSVAVNILTEDEENYYQTPRRSIISVDEKVPSYYPNSCDTVKMRKSIQSPSQNGISPVSRSTHDKPLGLKHLVNSKIHRERKENLYITSPQKIIEQRNAKKNGAVFGDILKGSKGQKTKKTSAHKVSENVYAVRHANPMINNNDVKQTNANNAGSVDRDSKDMNHLSIWQNIDFKFDDTKTLQQVSSSMQQNEALLPSSETNEDYENCFQAAESANRLLQKYATLARYGGEGKSPAGGSICRPVSVQQHKSPYNHHLKVNQDTNTLNKDLFCSPLTNGSAVSMSLSSNSKLETPTTNDLQNIQGLKKFASLPRFKKIDFSPLKLRINNVLQRNSSNQQNQPSDS